MHSPKKTQRKGGSEIGWHFIQDFVLCPWRFYLKQVIGLRPSYYARALLFGSAFHSGKEAFYTEGRRVQARPGQTKLTPKTRETILGKALLAAESGILESRDLYADQDEFQADLNKVGPLLEAWVARFGWGDLESWEILEVETEHRVGLPSGAFYTVRFDVVLGRGKPGSREIRILDTKTTGYSLESAMRGVEVGGQVLGYVGAARKLWPGTQVSLVADAAYWARRSLDPTKIICDRGAPLSPSPAEIRVFHEEIDAGVRDFSTRVQALFKRGGASPHTLFPRVREPGICTAYNRPCEYWEMCRTSPKPGERVFGFTWDPDKTKVYEAEIGKGSRPQRRKTKNE